jgi:hypothetical protein
VSLVALLIKPKKSSKKLISNLSRNNRKRSVNKKRLRKMAKEKIKWRRPL